MAGRTPTVHRLKVTLRGVRPPVWRRIEVRSDTNLHQLSAELEAAMGWCGGHLHAFEVGDVTYQLPANDVLVEAIEPIVAGASTYPRCSGGRRACPPEDCGGPWGYAELLRARADPAHPDHESMVEGIPPGFDPVHFNACEATEAMRHAEPWHLP